MRTSSKNCQGRVISHAFSTALHSLLSHTIILPCPTHIPLSFNTLFTPFIYLVHVLPLNSTSLTSNPTLLFTNQSSSILSMCPNHLNTLCSARPANSHNTSFSSCILICHLVHTHCYSFLVSLNFNLYLHGKCIAKFDLEYQHFSLCFHNRHVFLVKH